MMLPLPCLTINCFISSTFHFSSSEVHLIRRDSSEDPQTTETRQLYQQKNKDPESLECLLELTQEQNVCQVLLTFSSFWHWSNLEPFLVFEESEYNKTEAEFRKDVDVLWDTDKGGVVFLFFFLVWQHIRRHLKSYHTSVFVRGGAGRHAGGLNAFQGVPPAEVEWLSRSLSA